MAAVRVTHSARSELDRLIRTRELPADTRERVKSRLRILHEFPESGVGLEGKWRDFRALVGPWGWLIVVYAYFRETDEVVVISFQDARASGAATSSD